MEPCRNNEYLFLSNSVFVIKMNKSDNHSCVQVLRSCWGAAEQVRAYYVDWRMLRDVKRRQMAFEYADERLRINALRKNTILPKELQVLVVFYPRCFYPDSNCDSRPTDFFFFN